MQALNKTKNMSEAGEKHLQLTECCICFKAFTDPRMLPCIHTFCLGCLEKTGEAAKKKPGETLPCPVCRKFVVIPSGGMTGLQKNFFVKHPMDVTTMLQLGNKPVHQCCICKYLHEGDVEQIKEATMRCIECDENLCEMCSKAHRLHKLSKTHKIVKIGVETDEDVERISPSRNCVDHNKMPLDYYCFECKKTVCDWCLHEGHIGQRHECKEVKAVADQFCQIIDKNSQKISSFADGVLSKLEAIELKKVDHLLKINGIEVDIQQRHDYLLEMIEKHTKSLLEELRLIKHKQLKEFAKEKEEIECFYTILKGFEAYSIELRSKGSASDVCSCFDEMRTRADELEKDHDTFFSRPFLSVDVSFDVADVENLLLANNNIIGRIREVTSRFESSLMVVGPFRDGWAITTDVVQINLNRPNEVSKPQQAPSGMVLEATAAIHDNTIYLAGLGIKWNEIWKYNSGSGWVKCASLVQGRRRHCKAFLDGVLYICGGYVMSVVQTLVRKISGVEDPNKGLLDSVEAYDPVTNSCSIVGKLVNCVCRSGNCVPFKHSLYIFGGADIDIHEVGHVQVYNTKENTCTLLSKTMPRPSSMMRAALWETSVILLGCNTCFIYNFETGTWQEREQFKTDLFDFSLFLEHERIFVIGGEIDETDVSDISKWKCRDDLRYVPLASIIKDKPSYWKIHAKLPIKFLEPAFAVSREFLKC